MNAIDIAPWGAAKVQVPHISNQYPIISITALYGAKKLSYFLKNFFWHFNIFFCKYHAFLKFFSSLLCKNDHFSQFCKTDQKITICRPPTTKIFADQRPPKTDQIGRSRPPLVTLFDSLNIEQRYWWALHRKEPKKGAKGQFWRKRLAE